MSVLLEVSDLASLEAVTFNSVDNNPDKLPVISLDRYVQIRENGSGGEYQGLVEENDGSRAYADFIRTNIPHSPSLQQLVHTRAFNSDREKSMGPENTAGYIIIIEGVQSVTMGKKVLKASAMIHTASREVAKLFHNRAVDLLKERKLPREIYEDLSAAANKLGIGV